MGFLCPLVMSFSVIVVSEYILWDEVQCSDKSFAEIYGNIPGLEGNCRYKKKKTTKVVCNLTCENGQSLEPRFQTAKVSFYLCEMH